jgi:uncharacterized protein (DUF2126 family)/transglutaminase-like putative cysteine protease
MSIRVALHHKTEYHYDRLVTLAPQVVRLRPAPHCRTPILSYSLKIQPGEHYLNWQQDPYSNYLARLVFPKPTRSFVVEVDVIAELTSINPFDFFIEPGAADYPFTYDKVLAVELHPYLEVKETGPKLTHLVEQMRRGQVRTIDYLVGLNRRLHEDIRYIIRMEPGIQTCEETLTRASGSCRDSAWLLVQLLRRLGLAARFVSGYLIQLTADQPALDGPSGPVHDFTDLHAWTEVYLPGAGWVGLDPTSGLLAGEGHLPLAATADPQQAAPISGSFQFDAEHEDDEVGTDFHVAMTVTRILETPRVTKPYTEDQWRAIDSLGRNIDQELTARDVRLTMGGEPTFVGIDERDSAEWNTAALGPVKRQRADVLLRRLRDRFAPGGLLHFGQGKWYPGESLPRWAFGCYWRRDGLPLWNEPSLVAEEGRDYGYGPEDARVFIDNLARRLRVHPEHCLPGYEDAFYYLWKERRLPDNVDPLDSHLENPEERARLAKVFEQGLAKVVGYALPLCKETLSRLSPVGEKGRGEGAGRLVWRSGPWFMRAEHMFLIPGDSPMGFRLPLDSLPWEPPEQRQSLKEPDLWAEQRPLPTKAELNQRFLQVPVRRSDSFEPAASAKGDALVRTALCVESRHGRLYVFMPPQERVEDYLELVTAIEATARSLHMPVMIEGYPPPHDGRLVHFKVTPDPGVIEVNIHPAHDWSELVHNTETLYEEARQARLCTEKFMLDGRHTGTGGGNHIVIGGPTPADSPILRRPDLLRSLIGYWHNHPSLSYLFSGLFLGPTSQAPRVDEARNDSLYELELAFQQIPEGGQIGQCAARNGKQECSPHVAPWLVDRVFRNLLVDVTGNTHRAEWCIDKLYSPDHSSGRLGLVEFRGFEMPPHPRMSLVQHLLLRAMIARFWQKPYEQRLVRWGTELHDRFLLPHFVAQDFRDVLEELNRDGYAFDPAWFAPHFEFRFPLLGSITKDGTVLELRQAIELWHVLGEEAGAAGTVRYVDSSLERLEVKVRGMIDSRHMVTCNGRRVPLHPTGVNGEYVAGVRYRAWQPAACLHPTIAAHAPLVLDLVDTWMNRSLGGCTYHVAHPGGRAYDTFPVNANEAEGRRIARFFPFGHTPGTMTVPPETIHAEFPFTLDLRQAPQETADAAETAAATRRTFSARINGAPEPTSQPLLQS